jgi:hypothetical protein
MPGRIAELSELGVTASLSYEGGEYVVSNISVGGLTPEGVAHVDAAAATGLLVFPATVLEDIRAVYLYLELLRLQLDQTKADCDQKPLITVYEEAITFIGRRLDLQRRGCSLYFRSFDCATTTFRLKMDGKEWHKPNIDIADIPEVLMAIASELDSEQFLLLITMLVMERDRALRSDSMFLPPAVGVEIERAMKALLD